MEPNQIDQLNMERVTRMVSDRPVVIFIKTSCGTCTTVQALLTDFGLHPVVYELGMIPRGREIEQALSRLGCSPPVPAVFIRCELVGGVIEDKLNYLRSVINSLPKL